MSVSIAGAAALTFAAQFGQPDFPTAERVQECLPAVSMLMAVSAIEVERGEDKDGKFAELFENSSRANLSLVAWESYYNGLFWDDPAFEEKSLARSTEVARQTFAVLRGEAEAGMAVDQLVAIGFECIAMTAEHTLITNMDGSAGEI